ncbi:protein of unknown function [Pseudomonas mediterranea]
MRGATTNGWAQPPLWRGDSSPLGCVAALNPYTSVYQADCIDCLRAATQPSGDESPRHKSCLA